jgi:hypothetical protein
MTVSLYKWRIKKSCMCVRTYMRTYVWAYVYVCVYVWCMYVWTYVLCSTLFIAHIQRFIWWKKEFYKYWYYIEAHCGSSERWILRFPTLYLLLYMEDPRLLFVVHGGSPLITYCLTWKIPTLRLLLYMEYPHISPTVVHGVSPHFTYCCTWRIPTLHPQLYIKRAPSGLSTTPKPLPKTKVTVSNFRVTRIAWRQ